MKMKAVHGMEYWLDEIEKDSGLKINKIVGVYEGYDGDKEKEDIFRRTFFRKFHGLHRFVDKSRSSLPTLVDKLGLSYKGAFFLSL